MEAQQIHQNPTPTNAGWPTPIDLQAGVVVFIPLQGSTVTVESFPDSWTQIVGSSPTFQCTAGEFTVEGSDDNSMTPGTSLTIVGG